MELAKLKLRLITRETNDKLMKNFVLVVTLIATAVVFAENPQRTHKKSGAERMAAREKRVAAAGGMIEKPYTGKYIYIVNDQSRVPEDAFFAETQSFEQLFSFPVRIVPPKSDMPQSSIVITISDNKAAPALLVAPEVPWAGVNVGALAVDNPRQEVLNARLTKELWRAFMYSCGAANSQMQPCVMRPIFNLKDLDANSISVPTPDSLPRIMTTANKLGIRNIEYKTYKTACEEGWAPTPTNEVQQAIWNETHKIPSEPLKIKYEKK